MIDIITHEACQLHDMGQFHPESPARIEAIMAVLQTSALPLQWHSARPIDSQWLYAAHAKAHVDHVLAASPIQGYKAVAPDVLLNPFSLNAALHAAGSVIQAVDKVYQQQATQVFCLVRPPGHHAEYNQAMGFCFFNTIASGVIYAIKHYGVKRAAIVDFDVHHGNGTQHILKDKNEVLFCSSFQHPFYPFTPLVHNYPNIIHLPLAAGTEGEEYRLRFEESILAPLQAFKPDIVFVSAGFDAHKRDPIGGLNLDEDDFYWLGHTLANLAANYCENHIITVLEGGYHLEALANSTHSYLCGLYDGSRH